MKSYVEFLEQVKRYPKSFAKCNVTASTLTDLQNNYTITETYIRKENNSIVEKREEIVSAEYYGNIISGCGFFKDRISKSYTMPGYIMTHLFARNPYDTKTTVTRDYTFTYNH